MRVLNSDLSLDSLDAKQKSELLSGIANPRAVTLGTGCFYRLARSTDSTDRLVGSPWWWSDRDMQKLLRWARELGSVHEHLSFVVRTAGAVKFQWSSLDCFVQIRITNPIRVFMGRGKWMVEADDVDPHSQQRSGWDGSIVFQASNELDQVYIPGIRETRIKSHILLERRSKIAGPDKVDTSMQELAREGASVILHGKHSIH